MLVDIFHQEIKLCNSRENQPEQLKVRKCTRIKRKQRDVVISILEKASFRKSRRVYFIVLTGSSRNAESEGVGVIKESPRPRTGKNSCCLKIWSGVFVGRCYKFLIEIEFPVSDFL